MEWTLLAGIPDEDVRRVIAAARRRTFARNEVLFHEGDPADSLHLIAKGRVAVHVNTAMGERTTVDVHGRGDVVGELALLDEAPRAATVVALEPTETHSLHRTEFEHLRAEHPQIADVLTRILAARLRGVSAQLLHSVYSPVEHRLLRRLAGLLDLYHEDGSAEIEIPLTQEHLAGLAATTRSTVNRILRREEDAGILELRRGRVVVVDPDALRQRTT